MTGEEAPKKAKMRFGVRLILCLAIYGTAAYFKFQGDYITGSILAVSGIAAFAGFRAGALGIFILLMGASIALWVAPTIGVTHEATFAEFFGTTGLTNRLASIVAVAIGIVVLSAVVSKLISRRLIHRPRLDATNRWIGFALGGVEGAAMMVLLLGGVLMIEPRERERAPLRDPNDGRGQMISKFILKTSERVRQSSLGPAIIAYNPFETIPQLNKFEEIQDTVQVLKDPEKIQRMMYHPSIRQLQRSPEVQSVVDELWSDPEFNEILRSRQIDAAAAMKLMNHPAVLRLLDQPGFVERAAEVIEGMDK